MLIYIMMLLVISTFGICTYKLKNKQKHFLYFACIVLFLVSGLRDVTVGSDTVSYIEAFNFIKGNSLSQSLDLYFEKGYILYNYIISRFFSSPQLLLIISSFITILLIGKFIYKNSKNAYLSIYLFITLMYYYSSMNILRQYIAVSIIAFGYEYVKKRKFLRYLLCIVIAALFHNTALMAIVIYYLYGLKFSFKKLILFFLSTLVIYFMFVPFFNIIIDLFPRYTAYETRLDSNNLASYLSMLVYTVVLFFGLIFKYYEVEKKENITTSSIELIKETEKEDDNLKSVMTYIILIAVLLTFLSTKLNILARANIYFSIFTIIYIPNVLKEIKNKDLRNLWTYIIVILFGLYNLILFLYRPDWHRVVPYKFFF
ncbi:EpsG family protein [Priestia flexa]|uniref:EpsG family protein n=1 Tax=Priestia flexa TaxID=86664 RepID=UPI001B326AB4|nr:EpsG family protein [Priestia flexa]